MKKPIYAVLLLSLFLVGCAGSSAHMRDVPDGRDTFAPETGKALVVFMRPSGMGFAVQSSVFDITSGEPDLVGIVSAKTKVAYSTDPGQHRFMVIGESADFMDANVQEGLTYYSLVTPRMGFWKARFSLKPVHKAELGMDQFAEWFADTRWVENTQESGKWAMQNMTSIKTKQADYLPKWLDKPDKPILVPDDGQ